MKEDMKAGMCAAQLWGCEEAKASPEGTWSWNVSWEIRLDM